MKNLEEIIKSLPPELHQEVENFVACLIKQGGKKNKRKLKLDWSGALRDLRDKYTSVELQHKVLEWRIGEK